MGTFHCGRKSGMSLGILVRPEAYWYQGKETLYSVKFSLGACHFLSVEELEEYDPAERKSYAVNVLKANLFGRGCGCAAGRYNFVLGALLFVVLFAWFEVLRLLMKI